MTPLRATACLLAAGLGIWLLLSWGGMAGDAEDDPYAAESDPTPVVGDTMDTEVALKGAADDAPSDEPEIPEQTFRFVVRHTGDERLLEGVRIDDPETGYVGTSNDRGELEVTRRLERFDFEATMRGYLLSAGSARGGAETVVYMTPGVPVRGVVLDRETRAPVVDAQIRTWDDDARRFVTSTLTSDENGRFELLGVRLSHPFTLLVKTEGLVPVRSTHTVHEEDQSIEVLVGGAGRIHGRVKGLSTGAEATIAVFLSPPGRRLPEDRRPHDPWAGRAPHTKQELDAEAWTVFRTLLDEEGRYEIKGVPLDMPVQVVARASAREQVRSDAVLLTTKQPEAEVDLEVRARGALRVFFIDENGGAMQRAHFELQGPYADFALTDPTYGQRGSATFADIPVGTYQLIASVPDGPRHATGVTINKKKTTELTIHSVAGDTLSGTVRGPQGELVPGAKVVWVPSSDRHPRIEVTADRRGAFFMRGVVGRSLELHVIPPPTFDAQSRYDRQDVGRVHAGQKRFIAELRGKPSYEGTVFGRRVIPRVRVDVYTKRYSKTFWFKLGEDGAFTLPGLPEPKGVIVFRAKDFAPSFVQYTSYRQADQQLTRVWLEDARKVLVTVHAAKGGPVAGARIRPADPRLPYIWRADARGEAELAGLPSGPTSVAVDSEWHDPQAFSVQAALAGKRNHLDLGPVMGVVEGYLGPHQGQGAFKVMFFEGSVQSYYRRRKKNKMKRPPSVRPNAAGWFEARIPPGKYEVWAFRSERWAQARLGHVTVKAGERIRIQPPKKRNR
ncbi:MAG: carboxypeptidase-like regulatory domain-containing protein [Planctomycetota bacterium]|nr:carboxypeptidase-like regulatory domain-containing protein [Planctomycetota bacterium]